MKNRGMDREWAHLGTEAPRRERGVAGLGQRPFGWRPIRSRTFGGVLGSLLVLVLGLLLGAGAMFGLNYLGHDFSKLLKGGGDQEKALEEAKKAQKEDRPKSKDEELDQMIAEARRRREQLDNSQAALALRRVDQERENLREMKRRIDDAELALKKKIEEAERKWKQKYDDAEKQIREHQLAINAAERQNIEKMAKMWVSMEPEQAALVALKLDEGFTARILYTMAEKKAALILAKMDGSKAAVVLQKMQALRKDQPEATPAAEKRS